jgi:hypothetical protein
MSKLKHKKQHSAKIAQPFITVGGKTPSLLWEEQTRDARTLMKKPTLTGALSSDGAD